jgi:hypothetical protein
MIKKLLPPRLQGTKEHQEFFSSHLLLFLYVRLSVANIFIFISVFHEGFAHARSQRTNLPVFYNKGPWCSFVPWWLFHEALAA